MNDFEMTEEQLAVLLDAMKPTPVMRFGSYVSGMDRQERANEAWKRLGMEMGFDHMTVRPNGRGDRYFSAEPVTQEA